MQPTIKIFEPNNHSKWQIEWVIAAKEKWALDDILLRNWEKEKWVLGDILLRNWPDLQYIRRVEQVQETEQNSNNFKITSDVGIYLLKRKKTAGGAEQLSIDATISITKYLFRNGVNVSVPISTRGAAMPGRDYTTENGYTYTLYPFTDGNHFRGTLPEIANTAKEFGLMNFLLRDIPNQHELRENLALSDRHEELRAFSPEAWSELFCLASKRAELLRTDEFSVKIKDYQEIIERATITARLDGSLAEQFRFAKQFTHYDLHPHNLLADKTGTISIIDLDSVRWFERDRAVAFALHRLIRQYIILSQTTDVQAAINNAKKVFFLNYYIYDQDEVGDLSLFIQNEALSRLTYAAKSYYQDGNAAWVKDVDKQVMCLKEAEYFAERSSSA